MKRLIALMALLALMATTAFASAEAGKHEGPFEHGPGFGIIKMADELNLTAEQKRQVALILKNSREQALTLRQAMKTAHEHLADVMAKTPGDEAAVRQAAREMAKAGEELAVHAGKVKAQVDGVLTPEQKAKMAEKRAQFKERFKERSEKHRGDLDQWIEQQLK